MSVPDGIAERDNKLYVGMGVEEMLNRLTNAYKKDSPFRLFLMSLVLSGIGYGIYKGMLDNYLAQVACMGELDRGITEFFRELPGLMLVFLLAVFYTFSAERMFKIGAVIMLAGMTMQSVIPANKVLIIIAIFIYSLGEHIQLGMRSTMALEYSHEGRGGEALGYQNASYQIGTLAGYIIIAIAFTVWAAVQPFKPFFFISAVLVLISMLFAFGIRADSETDKTKSRFYFRRKFGKYYMLEVFYGARKQVFFTFGPYVLILFYGANATVISLLFAISAIACFICSPIVGKIIDRVGYKIVMISDTLILVIVCFFYGFAHHIFPMHIAFMVCCVNYVLDSVISLASMASSVYVQDISDDQEEMRATISTGISVNHMITILIALFGGWIWQTLGMETLFILSAILGLCNSAYAATIKKGSGKR
ncbi:MAG: MFS transporter [Eubacteriales bacterium]|nr:MFS transporter [Eubacteriales bacterium]